MKSKKIGIYMFGIALSLLAACGGGGGGGGGGSATLGPILTGTTFAGALQTKTYSNGTTVTAQAVGSTEAWATDHVTKTTTYTFADGGSNAIVETIAATVSTPLLTAATYPSNWTSAGVNVTKPSVSSVTNTYGDGTVATAENGSASKPFNQLTLSAQSITDPSTVVRSATTDYNLNWGVPDKSGPALANAFSNGSVNSIVYAHQLITGVKLSAGSVHLALYLEFA